MESSGWRPYLADPRVGGARAKLGRPFAAKAPPRFRGLNLRKGGRPERETAYKRGPLGKLVRQRGWFNFKVWTPDKPDEPGFLPIEWDNGDQVVVGAENSNSAAKKVINILKRVGLVEVDGKEPFDFYMTSLAELGPEAKKEVPARTRFYHYQGRFVSVPRTFLKVRRGKKREMRASKLAMAPMKEVTVEGVAVVNAFDGERFSVPFVEMDKVKEAVRKVLKGKTSIRSIQRQSMLGDKTIDSRMKFIEAQLRARAGGAARPFPPGLHTLRSAYATGPLAGKRGGSAKSGTVGWSWPQGVVRSHYFPPRLLRTDPFGLPLSL